MPFKSPKQETYLRINKPSLYRKWKRRYGLYTSVNVGVKVRKSRKKSRKKNRKRIKRKRT